MSASPRMNHRPWLALAGLSLLAAGNLVYADNEASEARLKKDVTYLASDECEGRGVETKGIHKAAEYIAKEFEKAGLKPAGVKGTWFQPFTINTGVAKLTPGAVIKLKGPLGQTIELKTDADFAVMGISGSGKLTAPVVFAGYGGTGTGDKYDDYKNLDVTGKVVVVIRRAPRFGTETMPFDPGIVGKLENAEKHKAAAILMVNDNSDVAKGDLLMKFTELPSSSATTSLPAFHVKRAVIDPILQGSLGTGLREAEVDIERELKPKSGELKGWTAQIEANVNRGTIACKNVLGVLEGKGPLANETVVIGAHYDHLGYGERGSLAKGSKDIHHGADDNGSGTTAILELARRFAENKDRQGRRLVFMTFSAEERGLLGSRYYCNKEPLFPLADTVGMVNLDMVGRLPTEGAKKDTLIAEGIGSAKEFEKLLDDFNKKYNFVLNKKMGAIPASDHDSFSKKKVPIFFLWTGTHPDYHKPTDTSERINISGMRKIVDLSEDIIIHLSKTDKRYEYVQVGSGFQKTPVGKTPRLGVQPNYEDNKEGVLLEAVVKDGPADKAGMKAGDRILEIAGKAVKDASAMTAIMAQQKIGQTIEITIQRDNKKLTLKATPQ